MTTDRERLYDVANVYVTLAAAQQYATARGQPIETARRELTVRMLDAYQASNGSWRYRRQSERIDLTAQVVIEGDLAVVVAVSVRGYAGKTPREREARKTEASGARKTLGAAVTMEPRPRQWKE